MRMWGTMVAALALVACQAELAGDARAPAPGEATRSQAGLDIVPLSIVSNGRTHRFRVEVARTGAQQERGMMYRPRLAPDRGMIFPFTPPQPASFWMRNTPEPLDLLFIGADGTIESIAADAVPFSEDRLMSIGTVSSVLEIAGGRAAELGLKAGDRVEWGG